MTFSYANPTSGPSAGSIGWFDFGNLTLNPGASLLNLSGTLQDGSTVTFDMAYNFVSGQPRTFVATTTPVYANAPFGFNGYTDISGNVALYANYNFNGSGVNAFTISNIVVKDSLGNPINNYTVILADSETTNIGEVWNWNTNGGVWKFLALLGINAPTLTGLGTQTATITSINTFPEVTEAAYVLMTQSPTQLVITSTETISGRQAFSIGFALTKLAFQKDIGQRIDANDQFKLDITGIPSDVAITSGSNNGLQAEVATVYATPLEAYTFIEAMAVGSTSLLSDYEQFVYSANATPNGSIPPGGNLPITFAPALGDDVTYTVLNASPQVFTKKVDKLYADIGEILTYTVTIENPNDYTVNNILFSDATPSGTIYIGNLIVSSPYTGINPATGIVITSIPASSNVTISWQVQVNTFPPIPNPVPNYANVIVPNGSTGMSNVVTTQVNTAYVTVIKTVDKVFATVNDILLYTLTLHNAGNVPASQVTITDYLPSGVTFIPGTLTGATGTPPTMMVIGSIPSMGDVTVTFQVKIDSSVPTPNPLINQASVVYKYTVDPASPNAITKDTTSNAVKTEVRVAIIKTKKTVDKNISFIGDILTYTIALTNNGNIPVTNVVINDVLANGLQYINNSLQANVPVTIAGSIITVLQPINPGDSVVVSFKAKVISMPIPNPIINMAMTSYLYELDPNKPLLPGQITSNSVETIVFRNAYPQQISDILKSVAQQEAALAAIADAEGAKIQKAVSLNDVSPQALLCINKSVDDMMNSINLLESILKQKLNVLSCQMNGTKC